jgi:hypothetical protein
MITYKILLLIQTGGHTPGALALDLPLQIHIL